MNKLFLPALLFAAVLAAGATLSLAADGATPAPSKDVAVHDKLDNILATQKQILARLDEMKEELYVIKVRATKK